MAFLNSSFLKKFQSHDLTLILNNTHVLLLSRKNENPPLRMLRT